MSPSQEMDVWDTIRHASSRHHHCPRLRRSLCTGFSTLSSVPTEVPVVRLDAHLSLSLCIGILWWPPSALGIKSQIVKMADKCWHDLAFTWLSRLTSPLPLICPDVFILSPFSPDGSRPFSFYLSTLDRLPVSETLHRAFRSPDSRTPELSSLLAFCFQHVVCFGFVGICCTLVTVWRGTDDFIRVGISFDSHLNLWIQKMPNRRVPTDVISHFLLAGY